MEPDWQDVRFFLAVARAGTFSAAAKALDVEHTTVARRVAALEHALDTKLVYRTARASLLTPEGERLQVAASPMLEAAGSLRDAIAGTASRAPVTVRIATSEPFASHWIAPRLPALRRAMPDIRVELRSGQAFENLSRGEAELAVRLQPPKQRDLVGIKIGHAGSGLYATPDVARAVDPEGEGLSSSARGVPLLLFTKELSVLQQARWFQPVIEHGDVRLRATSPEVIARATLAGHGVGVLPHIVAHSSGAELTCVSRRDVSRGIVWLVTHPEFRKSREVAGVQRFLRGIAAELR